MTPHFVLNAEPDHYEWKGFPPTIIIYGPDMASGDTVTRVNAPGAESVTRIAPSGQVSLVIQGAKGIGRSGETRVAEHLHTRLKQEGIHAELLPGTDDRGEDRRLRTSTRMLTMQIVMVPASPELWESARRSSASTSVTLDGAVNWIHESIQKKVAKTPPADRPNIVLALDAQHANALTEQAVIEKYIATHGDPGTSLGFGGVWIVGSTSAHCTRIGTSIV